MIYTLIEPALKSKHFGHILVWDWPFVFVVCFCRSQNDWKCKKVLLCDLKRRTSRHVTSPAFLSGRGEGTPPPVLAGGLHPVLDGGYSLSWLGVLPVLARVSPLGRNWNRTFDRTSNRTRRYPPPPRNDLRPEAGKGPVTRDQGIPRC